MRILRVKLQSTYDHVVGWVSSRALKEVLVVAKTPPYDIDRLCKREREIESKKEQLTAGCVLIYICRTSTCAKAKNSIHCCVHPIYSIGTSLHLSVCEICEVGAAPAGVAQTKEGHTTQALFRTLFHATFEKITQTLWIVSRALQVTA